MTDETKVFDVADNDLRAAASSCDANDVDLHHPLHPLVDAWEYVVGSTMYRKRDGTRDTGCRGGRRSVDEDDDKDEDVSGQGGCQPGRRGRDYVGEEPKRQSATPRWGRGGQPHHRGRGGSAGAPGEGEGRQVGGFVLPVRVGEPETVAARAALALHILALAMPNARAVCIVNFLKWERNGRGHGVHPMMAYEARGQGGENDEEGEMTTRRWW